jgi:hypothetical protein
MLLRENPSRKESNSSDRGHAVGFFFFANYQENPFKFAFFCLSLSHD